MVTVIDRSVDALRHHIHPLTGAADDHDELLELIGDRRFVDARATELGAAGELNVGQLVRSAWPNESLLVGFTTHHGQVTAASEWGAPAERRTVRPALADSFEEVFHRVSEDGAFTLPLGGLAGDVLPDVRLERAIGVVYRPETERASHWFRARLPEQLDVVIHVDRTSAVEPLERTAAWDEGGAPETYPSGL